MTYRNHRLRRHHGILVLGILVGCAPPPAPSDDDEAGDTGGEAPVPSTTSSEPPTSERGCRRVTKAWDGLAQDPSSSDTGGIPQTMDGIPDRVWITRHDEADTEVFSSYWEPNLSYADEAFPTYDVDGYLIQLDEDYGSDGGVDVRHTYLRDAAGRLLVQSEDVYLDGIPDSTSRFGYDVNGLLTWDELDLEADGVTDYRHEHTYDAENRQTQLDTDGYWDRDFYTSVFFPADGEPDERFLSLYTDGSLLPYRTEVDGDPLDGVPEAWNTFTFDADGFVITLVSEYAESWRETLERHFTVDERGNPIFEEYWSGGGMIETVERTFDDQDRVLTELTTWYGTDSSLTTFAYDDQCPPETGTGDDSE